MSRFFRFVFAACLLAIGTSTSAQAAGPDWPKSLMLVTASPGGIYYVYGEELTHILTEKLGFHSITSSASASSVGGTFRPIARAVTKLMTRSNLVGCATGRSAGFSPLRMRPV
jgi:TRAP-type uncharacterized transport system substrate-binding protein